MSMGKRQMPTQNVFKWTRKFSFNFYFMAMLALTLFFGVRQFYFRLAFSRHHTRHRRWTAFGGSWVQTCKRKIAIANFSTQSLHVVRISCILRLLKRIKMKEKMAFETAETILFILPQWHRRLRRHRRIHFIKTGEVFSSLYCSLLYFGCAMENLNANECQAARMRKINESQKIRCSNEWKCCEPTARHG